MSSLFVQEDDTHENDEVQVKQEHTDIEMESETEVEAVEEEEDEEEEEEEEEEDDPVIGEVPIHINPTDDEKLQLMLLQYTTRKKSQTEEEVSMPSKIAFKPEAGVVEMELPFEQQRFFSDERAQNWDNLQTQMLRGVVTKNESCGYYVGHLGGDSELHLTPITGGTTQLRPFFKYIDQRVTQKQKQREEDRKSEVEAAEPAKRGRKPASGSMHVVQMTAKSSAQNIPRLGGALVGQKKEEEEEAVEFEMLKRGQYDEAEVAARLDEDDSERLEVKAGDYVGRLMDDAGIEAGTE